MSVVSGFSSVQHFSHPCSIEEVVAWATEQRLKLLAPVTFGLLFTTSETLGDAKEIIEVIQIYGHVPAVIGCCASGQVADSREIENEPGFTVALYAFPNTTAHASYIHPSAFTAADQVTAFHDAVGQSTLDSANSWMLFASAERISSEEWLPAWDQATGHRVTIGGFASADLNQSTTSLFINGHTYPDGAVALGLQGDVCIHPVVSQGCRPVGSPWIVTQAEQNIIHTIGNRPILEVLRDTLEGMSPYDQKQAKGNIFIGLVLDEYKPSFGTGDFLVRNLAAIDPKTGAVAIASKPRIGQNLQFQIRDAHTASVDMEELLKAEAQRSGGNEIYGACVCDCIGRGSSLYGVPDHDASVIQDIFPDLPVVGIFCNGEFGPSRDRTFLHGYAASMALFVKEKPTNGDDCAKLK